MSPTSRPTLCLNGDWDFCPLADPTPLEQLPATPAWETQTIRVPSSWRWSFDVRAEYQPYDLFGYPAAWNDAPAGLLRRKFSFDPKPGERTWLVFQGVLQSWRVFVNGCALPLQHEAYLPIEFDITTLLRPGENELIVWCGPWEQIPTPMSDKLIVPNGSWFAGLARGIWQDVVLETRPAVWIQDVFVQTSVRRAMITADVTVENHSGGVFQGRISASVLDAGQALFTFPPLKSTDLGAAGMVSGEVTLMAVESATYHLESPWIDAVAWSPENPHLYQLEISLFALSTPNGGWEPVDTTSTRFGFRELWLDGPNFILNGIRINLRGDAWHYQGFVQQSKEYALNWYRMCRQTGINFVRLHAMPYPECYLEAADEFGMLIVDESAIYGSSKATLSDDPRFLANCQTHLEHLVRRDRNHPSVVIWSMQNEMRWVDGREGYRDGMPALTAAMRALDSSRPISYDGDNRLIPAGWCDIISMHYNIDGTIESWDRLKPLIFGEHGPFHYVSPQTCSKFGGPAAYLSFEACMEAIGFNERLFNEYARRQGVTGLTPFNTVNYALWALPESADHLPHHALTVNNGSLDAPLFRPNPAWSHLAASFKPVTLIADEYNTCFFDAQTLSRRFSLYNDTEHAADVRLSYHCGDLTGEACFQQPPGQRMEWGLDLALPAVTQKTELVLSVDVYHQDELAHQAEFHYSVFPSTLKENTISHAPEVLFLGDPSAFEKIVRRLPDARRISTLENLHAKVLILGPDCPFKPADIQPALQSFISSGGFVLVLEQNSLALGDLALSGRGFPLAFIADPAHPIFLGLSDADLRFWYPGNVNDPTTAGLVANAFHKPVQGDLRILLECGEGDFGWGGLLWSPLVEYTIGRGRLVCSQLELLSNCERVPAAAILLNNLLDYALSQSQPSTSAQNLDLLGADQPKTLFYISNAALVSWLIQLGIHTSSELLPEPRDRVVLDPEALDEHNLPILSNFLTAGGDILILPVEPHHQDLLRQLTQTKLAICDAPTYQLGARQDSRLTSAISPHDLYLIERVTYTPANYHNHLIARHALDIPGAQPLFESLHTPWEEFFIHGKDGEWQKIAIATQVCQAAFTPGVYGATLPVGQGRVIFCQVLPAPSSEKNQRFYSRLLANLGSVIHSPILEHVKARQDYGIESFMALPMEPYHDRSAMQAYFSDPAYTLNNLGEGVFGWMKRAEKNHGVIHIPQSAGRTWFLTVFVESEINRDPSRRGTNVLPDPSLVPDLFVETNCPVTVYLNGHARFAGEAGIHKIDDALLIQGLNRLAMICQAGEEDVRLNAWFINKFGDPLSGLKYILTMD